MHPVSPVLVELPEDIRRMLGEIKVAEFQPEYNPLPAVFLYGKSTCVSRWEFDSAEEKIKFDDKRYIQVELFNPAADFQAYALLSLRPEVDKMPVASIPFMSIRREKTRVSKISFNEDDFKRVLLNGYVYLCIFSNGQSLCPIRMWV